MRPTSAALIVNYRPIVKGVDVCVNRSKMPLVRLNQQGCCQYGFSLIELIIVLLIIGFISGMVLINIGNNFNRELRSEAERFQQIIIAGSDEAVFSSSEMGVIFQDNGYQLLRFNPALNLWQPYSGSIFEPYRLPETMALQWTVEGYRRDVNADILAPDDLFLNAQSFGDSDRQAETNEPLVDKFVSLNNELTDELITGFDLTPELLLSSSGELPVFEVIISAADGIADPSLIRISSDGFSLPSVTDLNQTLLSEE